MKVPVIHLFILTIKNSPALCPVLIGNGMYRVIIKKSYLGGKIWQLKFVLYPDPTFKFLQKTIVRK